MISALDRKLLRDIWHIREQALAIAVVISCGVACYVGTLSTITSLDLTQQTYYDRRRFADVFAQVKRAPDSLAARIADIPGVARVMTRVVHDVNLTVPGLTEPAVGRLISLPQHEAEASLNEVHLRRGRIPDPMRDDEVLASEAFADAHGFEPGDRVTAIINRRRRELTIVGVALSPEYIFQIRAGDMFPDDRRFGIFWMPARPLESAFDMRGAFNDVSLTLMPGAAEKEVIRRLDRLTEPYGGLGAYGRDEQLSHQFISDELSTLRGMSSVVPLIFLAVAAFLLNVVLSRIIATQREQIAALKAFGYSHLAVGWHYLKLTFGIVALGLLLGAGAGYWMGGWLTTMYAHFYRFPILKFGFDPASLVYASAMSIVAATLGTAATVRRAIRLPPAEAMRPPAPANYRPTVLERVGFATLLTPATRMILRHLERKPVHAALTIVGISTAVGILIMGFFTADSMDYILDVQFNFAQRDDVAVSFVEPRPSRVISEMQHLPGVIAVEPFRAVSARLRNGHRTKRMGIIGTVANPSLRRMIDDQIRPISLPDEGIVLTDKLAEILEVEPGQSLTIEVLEGNRPIRQVTVASVVSEFIGIGAYMERRALNRLMREGSAISGGYLFADPAQIENLYQMLKERPEVGSVVVRKASIKNFEDIMAENMRIIRVFYVVFGSIIAVGVVYNSAQVSLAERTRELASLRVLGFTRIEISSILLGELGILTSIAIPIGMLQGFLMASAVAAAIQNEQIRVPVVVESATYAYAAIVVLIASFLSGLVVRRRLDHLDLVAVLKTQE